MEGRKNGKGTWRGKKVRGRWGWEGKEGMGGEEGDGRGRRGWEGRDGKQGRNEAKGETKEG